MPHLNIWDFDVHYVNPQLPMAVHGGRDGLTLLCDFEPELQGLPVLIMSKVFAGNEEPSTDVSAHRIGQVITCQRIQIASGLFMICQWNAQCFCSHASRQVSSDSPIIAIGGQRLDIDVHLFGFCDGGAEDHESDVMNMMQTARRETTGSTPSWIYGYPLVASDAIRAWKGAAESMTPQRLLANEHARMRHGNPNQVRVYAVAPVPDDLIRANIEPYVLAAEEDFEIWQVIILVDIHWESGGSGTGSTASPTSAWRATRAIDFQLDPSTLLMQLGIRTFCGQAEEFCTILIRGHPWTGGVMQFASGEAITVKVRRFHQDIPLGTQWQMSSEGCSYEDMQRRLRPPGSTPEVSQTNNTGEEQEEGETSPPNQVLPTEQSGENGTDTTVLMQRMSRGQTFFIYIRGYPDHIAEELQGHELENPVLALRDRFARHFPEVPRNFLMMFMVYPQPDDILAIPAAGLIHASAREIPQGKSLILLDVEFYENHRPRFRERPFARDEWREVAEVSQEVDRHTFLQQIKLAPFCYGRDRVCLLTHRGSMWNVQDHARRVIRDGDYVVVRVKQIQPEIPVRDQWRTVNGECQTSMTPHDQRVTRWDRERNGGISSEEDEHYADDNLSLLQMWRPTFVREAHKKLRPPGNGRKEVTFNDFVEVSDTVKVDLAISNRFMQAFCETRQDEQLDSISKVFLTNMRFELAGVDAQGADEKAHSTKESLEGLELLPIADDGESPIDRDVCRILHLEHLIENPAFSKPKEILRLCDLLPDDDSFRLVSNQAFDPQCSSSDYGSTAVHDENPRLHRPQHVHDRFVFCEGLEELTKRVTKGDAISPEAQIPHPNLMEGRLQKLLMDWRIVAQRTYQMYELYTDGSKLWCVEQQKLAAGWAVVIVGVDHEGMKNLVGIISGRVTTIDAWEPWLRTLTLQKRRL